MRTFKKLQTICGLYFKGKNFNCFNSKSENRVTQALGNFSFKQKTLTAHLCPPIFFSKFTHPPLLSIERHTATPRTSA